MVKKYEYWTVNLSKDLEESIEKLFEEIDDIKKLYSGDKREFMIDWVRRGILFYREKEG